MHYIALHPARHTGCPRTWSGTVSAHTLYGKGGSTRELWIAVQVDMMNSIYPCLYGHGSLWGLMVVIVGLLCKGPMVGVCLSLWGPIGVVFYCGTILAGVPSVHVFMVCTRIGLKGPIRVVVPFCWSLMGGTGNIVARLLQ